ncbi:MAG TPA: stage II sporulation protein M [Actinomycetaceae bacterium]|nr:stage II sporulation protein M [Actinomycetaceae bacterium]
MDTDAFAAAHQNEWRRLEKLAHQRRLTGAEVDELTGLYRASAAHLSRVRTQAPDPALISRLSTTLGEARSRLAPQRGLGPEAVARFFVITLPASFYRVRWWTVIVGVVFVLIAIAAGWWFTQSPAVRADIGTPADFERYANEAFEAYYSNYPAPDFAAQVWTNNAWISFQAIGAGLTGFWPAYLLWSNAVAVGQAGGIMAMYGDLSVFFGLILPHGLMELTAVFVAIGAGLKIFWTWLVPGPRTRVRALREEGTRLITVALGLIVVLAISGGVEAFVTPSEFLPTWAKITIGALVLAAYWAYTLILGRRAVRQGELGDLPEEQGGYVVLESA